MQKIAKYKYFFAVSDFLIILFTLSLSIVIIGVELNLDYTQIDIYGVYPFVFFISIIFLLLFIFDVNNLYNLNIIITRSAHLTGVIKSLWYFSLLLILFSIFVLDIDYDELIIIILNVTLSSTIILYVLRVEVLRGVFLKLKNKRFRRNVLIVGDGHPGRFLAAKLVFENPLGINIVGFVDDGKQNGTEIINGKKVLGDSFTINNIVKQEKIDEILIAEETKDYDKLFALIDNCQNTNVNVKITSGLFGIIPQKVFTEKYANIPVIDISPKYKNIIAVKFKRLFDVCATLFALIILLPLIMVISLIIKLTSEGPILFKQTRIGRNKKPFTFYKFRSMYLAAEDDELRKEEMINFMKSNSNKSNGSKIINKSKVTGIGNFLRKTSLDELPQLINVLKGDMSLVGPRPCLPYEFENYDEWQKRRFSVLPGCTGVWQVMGRSSVSFNDSIVLDLFYINNMSPWLDLQLILKTIPVMLFARGGE